MARHDEPNEYGFAGDPTAPQPPPAGQPDTTDAAEAVAVPGTDVTSELTGALQDIDGGRPDDEDPDPAD